MEAIAEMGAAVLLRPAGVGLGRNLRPKACGALGLAALGGDDRGVDQRAGLEDQALGGKLPVDLVEAGFEHAALGRILAEAAQRRRRERSSRRSSADRVRGYAASGGARQAPSVVRRVPLAPAPLPFGDLCETAWVRLREMIGARLGRGPNRSLARRRRGLGLELGSGRGKGGGAAQVVDDREGDHVAEVAGKRRAAGAGEPVQALQGSEDALDGGAAWGDEGVAPRLPARQGGLVLVRAVHDAILDAARLEPGAARLALVALVAIDGALVAADEVVGDEALVHSGRGQHEPADQARALVDAGMEAIAEMGAAVLLRPAGVGLGRNLRPKACGALGLAALGGDDRGVDQRAGLEDQALGGKLPVDLVEAGFEHAALGRIL